MLQSVPLASESPKELLYLSPKQLAKLLGCSVQYLQKMRTGGWGPAYIEIGKPKRECDGDKRRRRPTIRYCLADVKAWIAANTVETD